MRVVRVEHIGVSADLGGAIHGEELDTGSGEPVAILLGERTSGECLCSTLSGSLLQAIEQGHVPRLSGRPGT